jgi:fermentation-respiration switch protein FrsA (DUF1100 family)
VEKLALVLAAVVAAFTALYFGQRALIYYPDRSRPSPEPFLRSDFRPLSVKTSDGIDLTFWLKNPSQPSGLTVVLFHGNAGHHGDRLFLDTFFRGTGFGFVLASYRGYGGNGGSPSEEGLYADGRAILERLGKEGIRPENIVLWGESLGAGVVTLLAAEQTFRAVILQAPFTSLVDMGAEIFPFLPVSLLARERYDSLARIGRITAPVLIVHGEDDEVVPVSHGRRLFAAANEPKQGLFFPGARHNDLIAFGLMETILGFLATLARTP